MDEELVARIEANPDYQQLKRKRNMLGGVLCIIALVVYYGYISLIAFNKAFLATPIGAGVTTIAVPIGISVIVIMVILTGIYVAFANKTYDNLIDKIRKEVNK